MLSWFRAFLAGIQGSLEKRTYPLRPESVSRRYHVAPVSHFSVRRFQARRGDPAFKALWEAMAILVALRCWAPLFTHETAVTVRSDFHGSLSAMAKLSSSSPSLNLVVIAVSGQDILAH